MLAGSIYGGIASYYAYAHNLSFETAFNDVNTVLKSTFGNLGVVVFYLIFLPASIAGVGLFQWISNVLLFILANFVPVAGFD